MGATAVIPPLPQGYVLNQPAAAPAIPPLPAGYKLNSPVPQTQPDLSFGAQYNPTTGKWEDEQPVAMDRFATTPTTPAPAPEDTGVLAGAKRAVKNVATMPFSVAKDFTTPPSTPEEASAADVASQYGIPKPLALGVFRTLVKPQMNEWQTANDYQKQADANPATANDFTDGAQHMSNMHRIASVVPLFGPIAANLAQRYVSGDKSGALTEGLGYALAPKVTDAALGAAGPAIEGAGDVAQSHATNFMNKRMLRASEKNFRNNHNPGQGLLEAGPGASFGLTANRFANQAEAAQDAAGPAVADAINNSQGVVRRGAIADAVNGPASEAKSVLMGPGGNPSAVGGVDALQQTYEPLIGDSAPEYSPLGALWAARKNIDKNINFNRNPSQIDPAIDNIRRDQRGNLANAMVHAAPEIAEPMRNYGNLAEAADLARSRTFDKGMGIFAIPRIAAALTGGILGAHAGGGMEGLAGAVGTDALMRGLSSTAVKSGYATGLFQLGKRLESLGQRLSTGGDSIEEGGAAAGKRGANQQSENNAQDQNFHGGSVPLALPPGQYESSPTPVRGYLPESASAGMQSVPADIQGNPAIPRFLQRALPPVQPQPIEAPPTPVRGALPETASGGRQSAPTEIQGTPAIPRFLQKALPPPSQTQLPPSPVGALQKLIHPAGEVVGIDAATKLPIVDTSKNALQAPESVLPSPSPAETPEVPQAKAGANGGASGNVVPGTKGESGKFTESGKGIPTVNKSAESQTASPAVAEKGGEQKYKFGNTQANIHPDSEAATALDVARSRIANSDLAGDGKDVGDGGNHVTVRYGIQGDDTAGIKKYLEAQAPFEAKLGKTEKFPPSEHSDGAAPIIAPIEAPDLHRMNAELEKHGDFTEPSFKEYKPHATIAYVKPEAADRYTGMDATNGKKFTVNQVAISKRDGTQEIGELKGNAAAPLAPQSAEKPEVPIISAIKKSRKK